jgi:hypothetical protein
MPAANFRSALIDWQGNLNAVRSRKVLNHSSDVNLKGAKNGWELARQVREINPAFPVVYIAGAAADEWARRGRAQ